MTVEQNWGMLVCIIVVLVQIEEGSCQESQMLRNRGRIDGKTKMSGAIKKTKGLRHLSMEAPRGLRRFSSYLDGHGACEPSTRKVPTYEPVR